MPPKPTSTVFTPDDDLQVSLDLDSMDFFASSSRSHRNRYRYPGGALPPVRTYATCRDNLRGRHLRDIAGPPGWLEHRVNAEEARVEVGSSNALGPSVTRRHAHPERTLDPSVGRAPRSQRQ